MNIAEKIQKYQEGSCDWRDLCGDLYKSCTQFLKFKGLGIEEAHDVFYHSLSRIEKICKTFVFTGYQVQNYINQSLLFYRRSCKCELNKQKSREHLMYSACLWNGTETGISLCATAELDEAYLHQARLYSDVSSYVSYNSPVRYSAERGISIFNDLSPKNRRIMLVALKNCIHMDDTKIDLLCTSIGVDFEWFWHLNNELCQRIIDRVETKSKMQSRRFVRVVKNPLIYVSDRGTLKRPIAPTNKDIAEVCAIPKGTVDSILYYAKRLVANEVD